MSTAIGEVTLGTTHAAEPLPQQGRFAVPDPARKTIVVVAGEFVGTFMFLLMSFIGTQTAIVTNSADPDAPLMPFSLLYIAASFGVAVTVNVWVFYRVTGGMFNPAVCPPISTIVKMNRLTKPGHTGSCPSWCCQTIPWSLCPGRSTCCRHRSSRRGRRAAPGTTSGRQQAGRWSECCPGCFHRITAHCPTRPDCILSRGRETSRDIFGAPWHWHGSVHRSHRRHGVDRHVK